MPKYKIVKCEKAKGGYNLLINGVVSGWYETIKAAELKAIGLIEDEMRDLIRAYRDKIFGYLDKNEEI